ncbi:hypothetical protein [Pyrobaculum ferrireducens]|uniref:hypothetical protein n=1 Tax=Pyrobaculum ferrireducens TaxID=1104324 RepID=UPI00130543FE|nr:hypothetical protein [Pyrobaculum ferrireducens]
MRTSVWLRGAAFSPGASSPDFSACENRRLKNGAAFSSPVSTPSLSLYENRRGWSED